MVQPSWVGCLDFEWLIFLRLHLCIFSFGNLVRMHRPLPQSSIMIDKIQSNGLLIFDTLFQLA